MRVLLVVEIDTDPTPGQFHRDRIIQDLQLLLENQVGHYNPHVLESMASVPDLDPSEYELIVGSRIPDLSEAPQTIDDKYGR